MLCFAPEPNCLWRNHNARCSRPTHDYSSYCCNTGPTAESQQQRGSTAGHGAATPGRWGMSRFVRGVFASSVVLANRFDLCETCVPWGEYQCHFRDHLVLSERRKLLPPPVLIATIIVLVLLMPRPHQSGRGSLVLCVVLWAA